ncbi:MAG: hypothetical protein PHN84_15530 [Desulfuromonadaceae bacterium]|nr:hypothetical protein [Desulfuromonadaceae bacterium]
MKCRVLKSFKNKGEIQKIRRIIEVPEDMIINMTGYIQSLEFCQARKVKPDRICGAPLREGINGFLSCSSPLCQVPVKDQFLT